MQNQNLNFQNIQGEKLSYESAKSLFQEELLLLSHFNKKLDFILDEKRLKLINPFGNPVFINIESELDYHKKTFFKTSIKKQPLARALGLNKEKDLHVFDVTAGLLSDSLLMYAMGAKISAFERNPLVQALITNALKNFPLENFSFSPMTITSVSDFSRCDVIFFDPMYKEVNQKSLPKKEMQVFREVVGKDEDALEVFEFLKSQNRRLVMKRSLKATPFGTPDFTSSGKSTAYDVYLPSVK